MHNRYYEGGVAPLSSFTVSPRGIRGLGNVCDDPGAAVAMAIIAGAANVVGGAVSAAGAGTAGKGGDAGVRAAGSAVSAAGTAIGDGWAAACITAGRGTTTGATPAESPEAYYARVNAETEARAAASRSEELATQNAAATQQNRNLMIGLGVVGAVAVGGLVFAFARR